MRLIFAIILGYYFFTEIPDTMWIVGILIIVGSNLYLVFLEGRVDNNKTGGAGRVPGDIT